MLTTRAANIVSALTNIGVCGTERQWFTNYLSHRKQGESTIRRTYEEGLEICGWTTHLRTGVQDTVVKWWMKCLLLNAECQRSSLSRERRV